MITTDDIYRRIMIMTIGQLQNLVGWGCFLGQELRNVCNSLLSLKGFFPFMSWNNFWLFLFISKPKHIQEVSFPNEKKRCYCWSNVYDLIWILFFFNFPPYVCQQLIIIKTVMLEINGTSITIWIALGEKSWCFWKEWTNILHSQ